MTPDQMTPAQQKRQRDVEDLARATVKVYRPKGSLLIVMIDSESEVYAHVHGIPAADPRDLVPVLREIAADIDANAETYRGKAGVRVREVG